MSTAKQIAECERWILDPLYWAQKFLGSPQQPYVPSSQQRDLWEAYRRLITAKLKRWKGVPMTEQEKVDARLMGISVQSGHGTGKDATAAAIGLHFLMCLPQPKVVATAPAGPQLHAVLWPEFGKWIAQSPLLREIIEKQSDKIYLKDRGGDTFTIKPRTIQPNSSPDAQAETLAGVHSLSVLYLIDEASGVPEPVFKPIEGGLTDPMGMIVMIYNPTQRHGFAIESQTRNRRDWWCLHWDAEVLRKEKLANPSCYPWFNEEAQVRLERKYGRDSDFYRVRVNGLPARESADTLIPWEWVMHAVERPVESLPTDPLVLGVDVAGDGEDQTIILPRIGPQVLQPYEFRGLDTTQVAWWTEGKVRDHLLGDDRQYAVGVDTIGLGRGVYDHLRNVARLQHVYSINVSEKPLDESRFKRLRDQVWWEAREAFERNEISIPNDNELIGELTTIKWTEKEGKIKVEGKLDLRSRGLPSPNKADALCMTQYLIRFCVSRIAPIRQYRRIRVGASNWKTA